MELPDGPVKYKMEKELMSSSNLKLIFLPKSPMNLSEQPCL